MRSEVAAIALVMVSSVGCATSARPGPKAAGASVPAAGTPSEATLSTLSAREAAAILRRAALMRALARTRPDEMWEASQELLMVWDDAQGRPEEDALLHLLDAHLLAKQKPDGEAGTTHLRVEVVRAWLDRREHERARAQATLVRHNATHATSEEQAEVLVGVGRATPDDVAELLARETAARVRATAAARWGDPVHAEAVVADLDPEDACRVATALASRRRLEGSPDAARRRKQAETGLYAVPRRATGEIVECIAELGGELVLAGDHPGAARVFARAADGGISALCEVLYAVADRVDPLLLDAPLLSGSEAAASDPGMMRVGCPSLLADIAARRNDRRLAQRMWARAQTDSDVWEEDRGFEHAWSAGVRLGRLDPLEPHGLASAAFRQLALARIFDEDPDARIDAARLAAALSPAEDDAGTGDEPASDEVDEAPTAPAGP